LNLLLFAAHHQVAMRSEDIVDQKHHNKDNQEMASIVVQ